MRTFLTIGLLFMYIASNSQDSTKTSDKGSVIIGIEGGPAFCDMRGSDLKSDDLKMKTYFSAGLYASYYFNSKFSLQSGIYYDRKGAKWNFDDEDEFDIESWMKFNYVSVPLAFRYTLKKKFNYYINAGPYFAVLLKEEDVFKFEDSYYIEDEMTITEERTSHYNPFEFGISVGIGISKNLGKNWLITLELNDNLGLNDIYDPAEEDGIIILEPEKLTLYTNSLNVMVGAAYRIK